MRNGFQVMQSVRAYHARGYETGTLPFPQTLNPCAQNRRFFAKIKGEQKAEDVLVVAIFWTIPTPMEA